MQVLLVNMMTHDRDAVENPSSIPSSVIGFSDMLTELSLKLSAMLFNTTVLLLLAKLNACHLVWDDLCDQSMLHRKEAV